MRIKLRPIIESDLQTLFEHQLDPEACRMAVFPSRDRDAYMTHWTKILADSEVTHRCIVAENEIAGFIACFERSEKWQVGYWIGKSFWGRGIASAALAEFIEANSRRPIWAFVAGSNLGSICVLEKCGFDRVGEEHVPASEDNAAVDELIYRLDG